MIEIIALSVFVSLSFVVFGIAKLVGGNRSAATSRLKAVTSNGVDPAMLGDDEEGAPFALASELVEKIGFWTSGAFETDKQKEKAEDATRLLTYAGYRSANAYSRFMGARVLIGVALALAAYATSVAMEMEPANGLSLATLGVLLGYFIPTRHVKKKIAKRQIKITKALPDCLDTIVICVEAGLGLNAAIDRVGTQRLGIKGDVLGRELKYMTYELQAGVARDLAFRNLGERNGVDDLQALAAFMVQSEKLGAGLVEALKIYSDELRTRRRQRAQEQANKAAVKLLLPLVFFIFPTMFLVILGPAIMQLKSNMKGVLN